MTSTTIELYESLNEFAIQREGEWDQIPDTRRDELKQMAGYIRDSISKSGSVQLTFICTHNSRRSHLTQIWAKAAADRMGLTGVQTFSGGTETTAMNSRVASALKRCGFQITQEKEDATNPVYAVRYSDDADPLLCFSKVFHEAPNPKSDFAAVMTCSSADEACPIVPGCDLRLPIQYEDPKVSDGTDVESATYDERNRQIAREMLYAISLV
ncbi:protein-tyrosine-phosphatase [Rhodopirellula sp. JC740]|uniref:Protein-tyrosine-phosphatase n=1 Tax=Rhodopirellula halodulae TaxID=2894198 RepID=A0ABS8NH29_9BACT|nr:protein-tyrosine-phosphatase [Rhodopirellula sp. JC740]MCC9642859.1 protein-tyrosine-phosphatase [Rhodopirellula sp. JC740]